MEEVDRELMRIKAAEKRRRSWARLTIAIIVVAVVVAGFIWLFTAEIPDGNREVLNTLLGAITGSLITIVAYYFGDSEQHETGE